MAPTPCPASDGSSPKRQQFREAPPMCTDVNKRYTATMETSLGTMTIHLDAAAAPKTVNNFVTLARYHYYDGVTFTASSTASCARAAIPTVRVVAAPATASKMSSPVPGVTRSDLWRWPTPVPTPTEASSSSSLERAGWGCRLSTRCLARLWLVLMFSTRCSGSRPTATIAL